MKNFVFMLVGMCVVSMPVEASDQKELRSDHFVIISPRELDESYVYTVKDMAEDFYKSVTQEFRLVRDTLWLWDNRAKIIIAKDKNDYLASFPCSEWSGACVDYRQKTIYTYPHQDNFSSLLRHELVHIIFREYVGEGKLPLWFDEGVAMYVDAKHGGSSYEAELSTLKTTIEHNQYIPFSELYQMGPATLDGKPKEYVDVFYLQSYSIIHFLIKKGSGDNFYNVLYFLRQGCGFDEALSKSYSSINGREELETQWKQFYQE
ncbi:MAG: hypothetical protein WCI77_06080 [Candidatus Omnitrophota bacterium]